MTADWKVPGSVEVSDERELRLVRVRGNLHRDLEPGRRDQLALELRRCGGVERLLIVLKDLVRIDSWGEEVVADVVAVVLGKSGKVAVVVDKDRAHLFSGLLAELRKMGKSVHHGHDEAGAREWFREERA